MSYFARKFNRAKWGSREGLRPDAIPADAVTADLRTQGNALSFWTIPNEDETNRRRIVLALVAVADRIDRFDLVWVAQNVLAEQGIVFCLTEGKTPVTDAQKDHLDAIQLDLDCLGKIALQIDFAISKGQHCRLTKEEVRRVLANAVKDGLVDLGDLKESVRKEITEMPGASAEAP